MTYKNSVSSNWGHSDGGTNNASINNVRASVYYSSGWHYEFYTPMAGTLYKMNGTVVKKFTSSGSVSGYSSGYFIPN